MSQFLAPLALTAGKEIIKRVIRRGRGGVRCPHCGGKINIRGRRKRN